MEEIKSNDLVELRRKLKSGVFIPSIPYKNNTYPLHYAVLKNRLSAISLMARYGARLCLLNDEGMSPLCYAVELGRTKCVKLLLALGANPNEKFQRYKTVINEDGIITQNPISIYKYPIIPVFHLACTNENVDIIELFIEAKVYIDIEDTCKQNALFLKYTVNVLETIKCLVFEGKINVNHENCNGYVPLYYFMNHRRIDIAEFLIENGANIHHINKYKTSIVFLIQYIQFPDALHFMHNNGANLNFVDCNGRTLIQRFLTFGNIECFKAMLNYHQDINQQDHKGNTAFHESYREITLLYLIYAGIDPYIENKKGETACQYAEFGIERELNQLQKTIPLKVLCFRALRKIYLLDEIRNLVPSPMISLTTNKLLN